MRVQITTETIHLRDDMRVVRFANVRSLFEAERITDNEVYALAWETDANAGVANPEFETIHDCLRTIECGWAA